MGSGSRSDHSGGSSITPDQRGAIAERTCAHLSPTKTVEADPRRCYVSSVVHKVYVLDTNVLLHDPRAIFKFDEHDVVLPIFVIEEVDRFKREMNELGRNARMLTRFMDDLR